MKLSTLPLAATLFVAGARSQGPDCTTLALSLIPSCAQSCFVNAAPTIGCSPLDFACQCRQQAALHAAVEACVASSCSPADYQKVIDGIATVCECVDGGPSSSSSTCSQIVSETVTHAPSTSAPHPSATPLPATTTGKSVPGGGGTSPTRSAAPTSTTGPVTAAADRQSRSGLGIVVPACAAAIALVVL